MWALKMHHIQSIFEWRTLCVCVFVCVVEEEAWEKSLWSITTMQDMLDETH